LEVQVCNAQGRQRVGFGRKAKVRSRKASGMSGNGASGWFKHQSRRTPEMSVERLAGVEGSRSPG
ncbi:hypothetical protein, partial [Mesorhizobium sp.]|uniref:hypothetical protein n=1 Tax=Mesorhizobium sp. TaxID=1871066 RepID=UPI00257B16FA